MQVLKKNFLPKDLETILINNGIDGCISVQADQSYQETDFLLKCASKNMFIKGVVGWVDLCSPDLEKKLEKYTSDKMFKGVRHIVQSEIKNIYFGRMCKLEYQNYPISTLLLTC